MKKVLFYASALVLAITGCTENEFDSLPGQKEAKGISFVVEQAPEDPTTRAEWTGTNYDFKWYAEKDRIAVWSPNIKLGGGTTVTTDWENITTGDMSDGATYKATVSASRGQFTAIDDANTLDFIDNDETDFLLVYPSTVKLEEATMDSEGKLTTFTLSNLPSLANQVQNNAGDHPASKVLMYDYTSAKKENHYDGVGEKITIGLHRPFTFAEFQVDNLKKYAEPGGVFGSLKSIKLEALGYTDPDGNNANDIPASILDYGSAQYQINVNDFSKNKYLNNSGDDVAVAADGTWDDVDNESSSIELSLDLPWTSDDIALMALGYVDRSKFATAKKGETMQVTYEFENITFTKEVGPTTKNWPSTKNVYVPVPHLDINDYNYLVVNNSGVYTLIVNKGTLAGVFEDATTVKWETRNVAVNDFRSVYIHADLADEDLALLSRFKNAITRLELTEETSIPADLLANDAQGTLQTLIMPKVTSVGANAFKNAFATPTVATPSTHTTLDAELLTNIDETSFVGVVLSVVKLPAYSFGNSTINNQLLKKAQLVTLDMSGVSTMTTAFPGSGFILEKYAELKEVTVKDGLTVSNNGFSECTALETVNGKVTLDGSKAFNKCESLKAIVLTNGIIPDNAFQGCIALTHAYSADGADMVLTTVGDNAFNGSGLVYANLETATTIGIGAFKDCASLQGIAAEGVDNLLYVGGTFISKDAFNGCTSLEYIKFTDATSFGNDILAGTNTKEIKFVQAITAAAGVTYTGGMFGASTATKLYINPGQSVDYFSSNTFYPHGDKNGAAVVEIEFASIIKE